MSNYTFDGFPADAFNFYAEIAENNEKPWFDANKARFKANVQKPAQGFVVAMGEKLATLTDYIQYDVKLNGSGSIMRIYRDVRFSKDKTPYKTNLALIWWEGQRKKTESPSFYFSLSADQVYIGGGLYMFPKDFMPAYRAAVLNDELGSELEAAVQSVQAKGYEVLGEKYARVPRGFDKEHPRVELLKHKGLYVGGTVIEKSVALSAELVDACFEHYRNFYPIQAWMAKVDRQREMLAAG